MVSIFPLIYNCSKPLSKVLETVPWAPITIDVTVTLIFHNFFSSLARSKYLSPFLLSLIFTLLFTGMVKLLFYIPCEFFASAFAGGLLLESE